RLLTILVATYDLQTSSASIGIGYYFTSSRQIRILAIGRSANTPPRRPAFELARFRLSQLTDRDAFACDRTRRAKDQDSATHLEPKRHAHVCAPRRTFSRHIGFLHVDES